MERCKIAAPTDGSLAVPKAARRRHDLASKTESWLCGHSPKRRARAAMNARLHGLHRPEDMRSVRQDKCARIGSRTGRCADTMRAKSLAIGYFWCAKKRGRAVRRRRGGLGRPVRARNTSLARSGATGREPICWRHYAVVAQCARKSRRPLRNGSHPLRSRLRPRRSKPSKTPPSPALSRRRS